MVHRPAALKPVAGSRGTGKPAWIAAGFALVALEVLWFFWFLRDLLPNAGSEIRRWDLFVSSVPEIFVPGLKFQDSLLGLSLKELVHFENIPQRLPILLAAGFIAASAIATGNLGLRILRLRDRLDGLERLAIGYGLGATLLGLATLMVGRMGLIRPWPVRVALALPVVAELACLVVFRRKAEVDPSRMAEKARPRSIVGLSMVVGPFLALMVLGAMLPTVDFDAIEYHLQGPKEYFLAGKIAFLPHNVYTCMPFSIEMLHLLGMELVNDWWLGALVGQLLIAGFAPASAVLIARAASRLGSPRAGWVAAAAYLTTPWIYRLAVLPYVEGPLCYDHAALIFLASGGVRTRDSGLAVPDRGHSVLSPQSSVLLRFSVLLGLMAGGAMATKYPGLISAVIPFALFAAWMSWRERDAKVVAGFVVGVGLVMTPWLAKNVIDTGNPVYPLGYKVFGGLDWNPSRDAKWTNAHGPKPVEFGALTRSVVEVAGRSDWQSPIFLALAPLALLRQGSRRAAGWLLVFSGYLFLTWWLFTHRLDRFWLPILPGFAILAGLGADWSRSRAWTVLLVTILGATVWMNLAFCSTKLAGLNEWTADLDKLRTNVPERLNPALFLLDTELPPDAKPLLVAQAAVFHMNHRVVYNTVFNEETIELLARGRTPRELGEELKKRGITHVYVDWSEVNRYRSPGNYGFTPFVTPEFFQGLVKAGTLDPPQRLDPRHDLYQVHSDRP